MLQRSFLYVKNALYIQWDVRWEDTEEVKAKDSWWPEKGLSPGEDTFRGTLHPRVWMSLPQCRSNELFLKCVCLSIHPLPELKAKTWRAVMKLGFINGWEHLSPARLELFSSQRSISCCPTLARENLGHAEQLLLLHLNYKNKDSKIVLSCRHIAFSFTSLWQLLSTGLFRENTIWPGCGKIQQHTLVPEFVDYNPWKLLIFLSKYATPLKAKIFLNDVLFIEKMRSGTTFIQLLLKKKNKIK